MTTPIEQKAIELKPCPFCGELPVEVFKNENNIDKIVQCRTETCAICGHFQLVSRWNTRHFIPEEQPKDRPDKSDDELTRGCAKIIAGGWNRVVSEAEVEVIKQAIRKSQEPLKNELEETRQHLADAVKSVLDARDILDPSKSELSLIQGAALITENVDQIKGELEEANERCSKDWSGLITKYNKARYAKEQAEQEREQLKQRVKELENDKELLDWAEGHSIDCRDRVYITINRQMIREAMEESGK